jgi:hypothetical protein
MTHARRFVICIRCSNETKKIKDQWGRHIGEFCARCNKETFIVRRKVKNAELYSLVDSQVRSVSTNG